MKELVAWLKANAGNVTLANQTAAAQVAGLLLQQATDTKVMFVPYRGGGPAMQDLLAGHIDLVVIQAAAGLPQVRAGTIKAFANLSREPLLRSARHPDGGRGRRARTATSRAGSGSSRPRARRGNRLPS